MNERKKIFGRERERVREKERKRERERKKERESCALIPSFL
jgi:hypothetical protein